ncbi:MAG TPA: hypothetical protein VHV99_04820, partial [Paraburkholderia sp.]|nr:hypothetical protein [Paraburkholderia sp.]
LAHGLLKSSRILKRCPVVAPPSGAMSSATELSVEKRRLPNNTFQISVPARNVRTAAGKGAGLHGTVDALMTPSRVVY